MIIPLIRASESNPLMQKQLDHVARHMEHITALAKSGNEEDVDFETDDPEDQFEYEVEDVAEIFKASVDCLMGLLPLMERTLAMADLGSPRSQK